MLREGKRRRLTRKQTISLVAGGLLLVGVSTLRLLHPHWLGLAIGLSAFALWGFISASVHRRDMVEAWREDHPIHDVTEAPSSPCAACGEPAWLVHWIPEAQAYGLGPAVPTDEVEEFDADDREAEAGNHWVAVWSCGHCSFNFIDAETPDEIRQRIRDGRRQDG